MSTSDSTTSDSTTPDSTTAGNVPSFTGRLVIDEHGDTLGSVDDVLFDPHDETPEYLVVNPGLLRRSHYLPLDGSYETFEGDIVVPWDQHWFKLSPTAARDHVLTPDDRRAVEAHYAHH